MKTEVIDMTQEWIPCSERMPDGDKNEIYCLVTCREWDMFEDDWGNVKIKILSYLPKAKIWNIKTPVDVKAWMLLPEPYTE